MPFLWHCCHLGWIFGVCISLCSTTGFCKSRILQIQNPGNLLRILALLFLKGRPAAELLQSAKKHLSFLPQDQNWRPVSPPTGWPGFASAKTPQNPAQREFLPLSHSLCASAFAAFPVICMQTPLPAAIPHSPPTPERSLLCLLLLCVCVKSNQSLTSPNWS